jgi:hypothetical protein
VNRASAHLGEKHLETVRFFWSTCPIWKNPGEAVATISKQAGNGGLGRLGKPSSSPRRRPPRTKRRAARRPQCGPSSQLMPVGGFDGGLAQPSPRRVSSCSSPASWLSLLRHASSRSSLAAWWSVSGRDPPEAY